MTTKRWTIAFILILLTATVAYAVEPSFRHPGFVLRSTDINGSGLNITNIRLFNVLNFASCSSGEYSRWNGTAFECYTDTGGNGNLTNETVNPYNMNASNITYGTLPDYILSSNIPFLNGSRKYTGNIILNDGLYIKPDTGSATAYLGNSNDPFTQVYFGTAFADYIYGLSGSATYIDSVQSNTIKDTSGNYYLKDIGILSGNGTFVSNNANGTITINSSAPPSGKKAVLNHYYDPSTGEVVFEVAT
jgi:hypothetical protein